MIKVCVCTHIIGKIFDENQIFIIIHKMNVLIEILTLILLIMKKDALMALIANFLMVSIHKKK